jgi:serine protease Do
MNNSVITYNKVNKILLFLMIIIIFSLIPLSNTEALSGEEIEKIATAIVLILPVEYSNRTRDYEPIGSGSGTIIDKELGLVLTNYHVVANPDRRNAPCEKYYILATTMPDIPPVPAFEAEFVDGSSEADVAVLRITGSMSGSPVKLEDLHSLEWETEEGWKSADDLHLFDDVIILGYPVYTLDIEYVTINVTDGKLSGFLNEENVDFNRAWIKTNAQVSFGNSGGAAIDSEGRLIGIPTAFLEDVEYGKLTILRSLDLADPYVDSIREDSNTLVIDYNSTPEDTNERTDLVSIYISDITFATRQTRDEMPENPGTRFVNQDTRILYAYFDYEGMQDGYRCSLSWMFNNERIVDDNIIWEWGENGTFFIPLTYENNSNMPVGDYTFIVEVEGRELKRGFAEVYYDRSTADRNSYPDTVTIRGIIIDADTGRGIPGAIIGILEPGVSIADFGRIQDGTYYAGFGECDRAGRYIIDNPLLKGQVYSVVILADGYEPLMVDNALRVPQNAHNVYNFDTIRLSRN